MKLRGEVLGLSLSLREHEVMNHVAAGKSNTRIAPLIGVSAGTVDKYRQLAYRKLGVNNAKDAIAAMAQHEGRDFGGIE